jgi:hypothetical protein
MKNNKYHYKWKEYIDEAQLREMKAQKIYGKLFEWSMGKEHSGKIETIADLMSTIEAIIKIKKKEDLTGRALAITLSVVGGVDAYKELIGVNPGAVSAKLGQLMGVAGGMLAAITGAKNVKDVVSKSATLPDAERTKAGYLKMLDFDDPYLELTDDKLENELLNFLLKKAEEAQEQDIPVDQFDVNRIFEEFVKLKFDRQIAGAGEKSVTSVGAKTKKQVAKQRIKDKAAAIPGAKTATNIAKKAIQKESIINDDVSKDVEEYLSSIEANDGEKGVDSKDAAIRGREYTLEDIMDPDTELWS